MSPNNLIDLIAESCEWLKLRGIDNADIAIILGSGLSSMVSKFEVIDSIPYSEIPNLAKTSIESHHGVLHVARSGSKNILIFAGRIHFYEGYEMWQVAYPVRLAAAVGVSLLITTGAAGGLNPNYHAGDIVLLSDHINLMPENPLRGMHDDQLGERFPDMSEPYDQHHRSAIVEIGQKMNLQIPSGVYAGLPGPSLETKAEYAYLHQIGADLVGMSIVPEVIVAVQQDLEVIGLCVVSNECFPIDRIKKTTIEGVVRTVETASSKIALLIHNYTSG